MQMIMIDPHNITKFNRTQEELEAFWLFSVLVAGKNAKVQAGKLSGFLYNPVSDLSPFQLITHLCIWGNLRRRMEDHKLGQYNRIIQCFEQSIDLDLRTCTIDELEAIHGVGPKTARFFLLHSRPKQRFAVLDTHILKWIKEYLDPTAPKNTPNGKRYAELEQTYLNHCDTTGCNPADLDLLIWSSYARV